MQFLKDDLVNPITDFESFEFKPGLAINTSNTGTANIEIALSLKYSIKFWGTLKMPLINYKVSLMLNWFRICVICKADRARTFKITNTKVYVPQTTL